MTFKPLIFFPIITVVAVAIHFYLWARLVRSTTRSRRLRRTGAIVIAGLGLLGVVGFMVTRTVGVDARWLAWFSYSWIALLFYLLLTLVVLEIPRAAYAVWARRATGVRGADRTAAPVAAAETPAESQTRAESQMRAESQTPAESRSARTDAAIGKHSRPERSSAERSQPAEHSQSAEHSRRTGTTVTQPRPTMATAPERQVTDPPPGPANLDRRMFLARACAVTAGGVAALAVGSGMYTAFGGLRTVRVTTPVAGLDPRLSGLRIAVISDTHLGPFLRRGAAERVVTLVNREQPDLVAFLGDLADGSVPEVGPATEPLRQLQSRLGTYFVTGNHEYSSDVDPWVDHVRALGMRPLLNERVEITSGGAAFDLAGVNDLIAPFYDKPGPDIGAALAGRDPSRPVLLMAHQPVQVHEAAKHGVALQLSGHTHGGQTMPVDRLIGVQQPVTAGLAKIDGTSLFVTRGVGFFGPPVRLGIPPEVAIVELQARP